MKICNLTFDEYLNMVESFHGSVAPGMIAGGIMVDVAMSNLPEGEFFDVICETQHCLTDAVQMLTPCTIGNGWLRIVDTGRFALIMYNKYTGEGVRVYIDSEKLHSWSEIRCWFMRERPKHEQDTDLLMSQFREAGQGFCSFTTVRVRDEYVENVKKHASPTSLCPGCGEACMEKEGTLCPACRGEVSLLA